MAVREAHLGPVTVRGGDVKIVDWNAFWIALAQAAVATPLALFTSATGHFIAGPLFALAAVAGFIALRQAIRGTVFEAEAVSFHSYFVLRRLPLAELRAANCEFTAQANPLLPLWLALALLGGGDSRKRGRSDGLNRAYLVNLSGPFGSAQLRFYGKRWRDAFLMQLREQAPRCRITRWS